MKKMKNMKFLFASLLTFILSGCSGQTPITSTPADSVDTSMLHRAGSHLSPYAHEFRLGAVREGIHFADATYPAASITWDPNSTVIIFRDTLDIYEIVAYDGEGRMFWTKVKYLIRTSSRPAQKSRHQPVVWKHEFFTDKGELIQLSSFRHRSDYSGTREDLIYKN